MCPVIQTLIQVCSVNMEKTVFMNYTTFSQEEALFVPWLHFDELLYNPSFKSHCFILDYTDTERQTFWKLLICFLGESDVSNIDTTPLSVYYL